MSSDDNFDQMEQLIFCITLFSGQCTFPITFAVLVKKDVCKILAFYFVYCENRYHSL